jgi:hypothetical protein
MIAARMVFFMNIVSAGTGKAPGFQITNYLRTGE